MKRLFHSPVITAVLLVMAVILVTAGTIGGTRAALNIQSDIYTSQFELTDIGVGLTEEGTVIAERDYVSNGQTNGNLMYQVDGKCMVERAGDTSLKIGKTYPLALGVRNTGDIPEYVRVTVYRYWVDPNAPYNHLHGQHGWFNGWGAKRTDMDPSLIQVNWTEGSGWTEDDSSRTSERTVLYYSGVLNPNETAQFMDSVQIDPEILKYVREETQNGTTRYVYAYDGLGFVLEVQVDAVQNKHSENARTSAWGRIGPG